MAIEIELSQAEQQFLSSVFLEVFEGGSTSAIQNVLGDQVELARELRPELEKLVARKPKTLSLNKSQWRTVYESLNAVVFGLGEFELDTCTGIGLQQACNTNLKICVAVWGVYGGSQWISPKENTE